MRNILLAIAFSALGIGGCSQSVPKCGDKETTDLVKQIAGQELGRQFGSEAVTLITFTVTAVRTTETNEKTGAHECAAQLGFINSSTKEAGEFPITYTVEMMDNGKEFYVNVFGL